MIQRNYYLDRLIRNMWNGEIKVITGIRRCGKSVLLFELFDEYLRNHGTDATQIIKIELDQRRYYKYRNPITLCEYVEQLVLGQQDKKLYLFIDEVQLTAKVIDQENGGIEVTIYDMLNELKAYKNLDVYVTGSNSKGLSKDIATEFRGRATQIHVFPLCFEEFYSAVGGDERKALDTYMLYGGMPRLLAMQDDKDKKDYLSSLYTELYVKDIVERNGIEREDILNDILNFLASQISSLTNPTNIANAIASMKNEKVNPTLVSNYVQDIVDSFLISVAKRYDVKGKTYFNYPNKYYYGTVVVPLAQIPETPTPNPEQHTGQHGPKAIYPPAYTVFEYETASAHKRIGAVIGCAERQGQDKDAQATTGSKVLDILLIPLPCIKSNAQQNYDVCSKNHHSDIHPVTSPALPACRAGCPLDTGSNPTISGEAHPIENPISSRRTRIPATKTASANQRS